MLSRCRDSHDSSSRTSDWLGEDYSSEKIVDPSSEFSSHFPSTCRLSFEVHVAHDTRATRIILFV